MTAIDLLREWEEPIYGNGDFGYFCLYCDDYCDNTIKVNRDDKDHPIHASDCLHVRVMRFLAEVDA